MKQIHGFSLLEILIAVSIGSLGCVAMGHLMINTSNHQSMASETNQAHQLALNALESLDTYSTISSNTQTISIHQVTYQIDQTVDIQPGYKLVTVTVTWSSPLSTQKMIQLRTRINPVDKKQSGQLFQLPPVSPLN